MQNKDVQEQMFNLIRGWQQSGLSQKMYCEQNGIRYHVFHYWFKRYRDKSPGNMEATFIPIQIHSPETVCSNPGIELIFDDGRRVLFHQSVSADFIKAIIS